MVTSLGLSMVVKNEEKNLYGCLASICDLFDDVVIIDTGSSDGTLDIIKGLKFTPYVEIPTSQDSFSITGARNISLSKNKADWVLILDADERISREHILEIRKAIVDTPKEAYFLTWRNQRNGRMFDDYKLVLVKKEAKIEFQGRVHSNPQPFVRKNQIKTGFLNNAIIYHDLSEVTVNRSSRRARLERYVREYPEWIRYQWFLGYTYFKFEEFDKAIPILRDACNSLTAQFPVECLNSHMVLTDINARKNNQDKCIRIMRQACSFYDLVQNDFEVKVNFQMREWLYAALSLAEAGDLEKIKSYEFAY